MQFYSGATGQAGRFSEGFCLRRVQHARFALDTHKICLFDPATEQLIT